MPIDLSPGSFAAITIAALFWWTVLSPAALLAVAASLACLTVAALSRAA
jgi:hypothetical protein